jgi:acyl transferase domain-containing protein
MNIVDNEKKSHAEIITFAENVKPAVYSLIEAFSRQAGNLGCDIESVCKCENIRSHSAKDCRAFVVFSDWADYVNQTSAENLEFVDYGECQNKAGTTVFLFPGNGIHQKQMLNILCKTNPKIEQTIKEIALVSDELYKVRLLDEDLEDEIINQIRVFASEVALAEFWSEAGCKPDYLIGHSMGEYAAAYCAGVFSIHDAIKMLIARSKNITKDSGIYGMATAETCVETVMELSAQLGVEIEISAYNAPELVTLTGKKDIIAAFSEKCRASKIQFNLINANFGGHSRRFVKYMDAFLEDISDVEFHLPQEKMLSTVRPNSPMHDIATPEYWAEHITRPVHFRQAVEALKGSCIGRVVDVGVSPVLLGMAMRNLTQRITWIPSVRAGRNYHRQLLRALGLAFVSGTDIDWQILYD